MEAKKCYATVIKDKGKHKEVMHITLEATRTSAHTNLTEGVPFSIDIGEPPWSELFSFPPHSTPVYVDTTFYVDKPFYMDTHFLERV